VRRSADIGELAKVLSGTRVAVTQPGVIQWIGTVIGEDHTGCVSGERECRVCVRRSVSWIESVFPEYLTEVS
jgi:hypothetical protein